MATNFRNSEGKEFTIVIDGYVLHRARTHGKLSIATLFDGSNRNADGGIMVDPALLVELCFYGCEHNAKIKTGKVSKEDFLRALTGRAFSDAIQATSDALTTFLAPPDNTPTPSPKDAGQDKGADAGDPLA